jgi:hypothetical protein
MSAPDFYFAVNAMARHIHDRYGKAALVRYWRDMSREYYKQRTDRWKAGGPETIAQDWRDYFAKEPGADVAVSVEEGGVVKLDVKVCPAIKHLREQGRDIVPYFCEHCDHTCGQMGEQAGYAFERVGGMGSCVQRFVPLTAGSSQKGGE